MRLFLRVLLLSSVVGPATAVGEGETKPARITEAQLLAHVDAHPRQAVLRATLAIARAEVAAAQALPNPAVSFEREAVAARGETQAEHFLRASLPIDLSGRRGLRIAAAKSGAAAAADDVERQRDLLRLEALDLFHAAAHARLRVELLQRGREELAAIVGRVRSRTVAGDVSGYDLGRLELELGEHQDAVAEAERELAVARRSLAAVAGRKGLVDADDELRVPAPTVGVAAAAAARADRRAAQRRRAQSEAELAAARRQWIPSLELEGGWKSVQTPAERANGYVAGLSLRLPLLDFGQAERARARAQAEAAQAEIDQLDVAIPLAIANAQESLARRVRRAADYDQTQVPRAETLLRRAEGLHREGERPVFELMDAYRTARAVRLRALDLRREAKQAEVELWRQSGRRP